MGCFDAMHDRHGDIQEDDIGTKPLGFAHRFLTILGDAGHFNVVGRVQQRCEAFAHDVMVINNQNGDLCEFGHGRVSLIEFASVIAR